MAFTLPGFLIGREIAKREGAPDPNRAGIFGGLTGFSPAGVLITREVARRDVQNASASATIPTPATTPTSGTTPSDPNQSRMLVEVPPEAIGKPVEEAERLFESVGLKSERQPRIRSLKEEGLVIGLDPEAGKFVDQSTVVKVYISNGNASAPSEPQDGSHVDRLTNSAEEVAKAIAGLASLAGEAYKQAHHVPDGPAQEVQQAAQDQQSQQGQQAKDVQDSSAQKVQQAAQDQQPQQGQQAKQQQVVQDVQQQQRGSKANS